MKISIITVLFNARDTICDTIESVHSQTYSNYEHILIDGASSDGSVEAVKRNFNDKMMVISEPDRGIYDAMNKGLRLATGDLIGFLNADDYYCRTDALEILNQIAGENPAASAVSGSVAIVDTARDRRALRAYGANHFRRWMLKFGHMPPHPGFYVRGSAFAQVGPFNPDFTIASDFEWMLRFYYNQNLSSVPVRKTLVAMRTGGVSTRGFRSMRRINEEVYKALTAHRIRATKPLIWSKYIAKVGQMALPSYEFPAPPEVQWSPCPRS